jgi:GH25 family lysozyme M1 (1,4-beta-N-acetylmuramidase)
MPLYQFADISHHKGEVDIQKFAELGHRIVISKASDNYHLPDKDGNFDIPAERHYDARFVDNFVHTREAGLVAGAYHFCRFDRPRPISDRQAIVQANLDYFQYAVSLLPTAYQEEVDTAILDMEQSATQLEAAGLRRNTISDMAKDMVTLFMENYSQVILYSGSWWTNEFLTREVTEWMAEQISVWEPEYVRLVGNDPYNLDYQPSVPYGFSNEYATSADDINGKLFAWQYTNKGRIDGLYPSIDLNLTALKKEDLYLLFHQDGTVDPPEPPPGNGEVSNEELLEAIAKLEQKITQLQTSSEANMAVDQETLEISRKMKELLENIE